uniref:Uncharacterized protein n=1 Tax=Chromera velia CCMP2878 TaxID=1169474 RepID=A0A0G4IFR9_9ALVE|eukprot:Cvel_14124.t1-p1 / transcript=Cvel_14124.t1 / gene=Cvel_14124 / organism=Chromera_velia_CCMP2878 / gene_product=hypothetical protein / transcript_product=hypothetical protein / location=Cvel_scaffold994:57183-58418(+) / protein_length=412 / sequence_SO=supercontig / SO=protein_coding / is_pseudo=false
MSTLLRQLPLRMATLAIFFCLSVLLRFISCTVAPFLSFPLQPCRQAREEAESAGAVIDDLRTRLAAAEAERASLESKVRTAVDKETSDIRRRLDDRSFSSEIVQLKETITRLSAEKETAVRARDSAQSELHTVLERTREETERLRALEIEFPQLQKELREAREQLVDLRGENSGLAAQVKQLQREADVQRGDAQAARGDLSELRKRYAKDVGESADLTRRSRKAETQAKAAANRIEPLQIREKQLQERNMKLGKEVAELKEQLQKAEHKNKELLYGKRIDMGGAASNKVRHLQLELLQVAEALAETAVAKESAESDRARLDALVTDLKSQLSAERTKAKGPADPAEMDILRAECEELRNENAHLLSCQEELARLERENAKLQRYVAAANFTAKQQVKEQEKRKQMQPAKGQA